MREILFRGKHTRTGEWIEGLLWKKKYHSDKYFISCFPDKDDNEEAFIVFPKTVGQYTGLTDKNGKKIFEDDIVKVTDDNGEMNVCSCGIGYVLFYDGVWYIDDEVNDGLYDVSKIYDIEVIGNIHDNP